MAKHTIDLIGGFEKVRADLKSAFAIYMIPNVCNSLFFLTDVMSSSVCSTIGGCTFDELCNGTQTYYACDNTVDIRRVSSIEQAKRKIVRHIDGCIQAIEIEHTDMKVSKFYIGKTYIRRIKKRGVATIKLILWIPKHGEKMESEVVGNIIVIKAMEKMGW